MNIDELIKKAKEMGSYLLTLTIRDKTKETGDLSHFLIREDFQTDDITPSLDACVRSMGIKSPKPVDVIKPEPITEDKRPLRIAIFSHGSTMPDSWSIGKNIKNNIKILIEHGHHVVFYVQEKSKLTDRDIGCPVKRLVPSFKREKGIVNEGAKNKMINMLREELTIDYDLAVTYDFFIQDCISYRQAISECGVNIKWLHFCRSGIKEFLNWDNPNTRYIYLNKSDASEFAKHVGVDISKVRVIPNEKSPEFLFNFDSITKYIINKFQLWNRDIIMTLACCSTRLDAKGLNDIIRVFVELKRLGKKVCLIVCNSNGKKREEELKRRVEMAKEMGLNEDEFVFTSLLANKEYNTESGVPNKVVVELGMLSNLLLMASKAEVSSNIVLESSMTKQLLVLNSDLPCLQEAADSSAILFYPFGSNKNLHFSNKQQEELNRLAKRIIGELDSTKMDKQFRHVWKHFNSYSWYYNFLKPILHEK